MNEILQELSKQDRITCTHGKVVNLYIVKEMTLRLNDLGANFAKRNCFFGAVKLTQNADVDIYVYIGYGIGFDGTS